MLADVVRDRRRDSKRVKEKRLKKAVVARQKRQIKKRIRTKLVLKGSKLGKL